ncbi:Phosphate transporter family, putative [Angomonas deanei]|uniref:Phosphate transporter n=1 Tax=Angomonas deanei TaxID=59799 RepID=A0A7G2CMZ0_9TRYP|nr:Phosphate transporter family, putative [Angomonas deanei]
MIQPYLWIVIVGGIVAFLVGAGVGMNDLANAFGTTYGAKILNLWQICILASICEFGGSISLGGAVTSTISGGIADTKNFETEPYLFMYGMLCASCAAFAWLAVATVFVLPVSSTHSVVGGVIGFGLVHGGAKGVKWAPRKDSFPFVGGVVPVIASWFISPTLTGAVAALIYSLIRFLVMRPKNCVNRATYCLPIIVLVAFFLEGFFIMYKGAGKKLKWSIGKALWVAVIIGAGAAALSVAFIPLLRRRIRKLQAREAEAAETKSREPDTVASNEEEIVLDAEPFNDDKVMKEGEKRSATGTVVQEDDTEERDATSNSSKTSVVVEEEEYDAEFRAGIERYNKYAEYVFRFLQVFTAICASFAHGASDVSNAVGPFAAIYHIYQNKNLKFGDTEIWILCIGGAGLVVGLSTFGIRLMRLLGEKITLITPCRGFSAELAAAMVVSFASAFGIPVSSTHCITGGVLAISICDVGFLNIKWMMVLKLYIGWIGTLIITAVASAAMYSQGVYAPIE